MSRDKKETYRSPEVEVLDIRQEGVICASTSVNSNISNPWNFTEDEDWYK